MRHVVLVIIVGLFGTFQNCSQPLSTTANDMLQQAQLNLPFAYIATADEIAYMSCTSMPTSIDTNAYFSFRVGAYNSGAGLALTPTFLSQTQYYNPVYRGQALSQSLANSGATLQLAIRQLGNYQNVLSGAGGAIAPGLDTGPFLSQLDANPMASQLGALSAGAWQNYFQGSFLNFSGGTGAMQSSLVFMESETASVSVRTNLNNKKAVLGLTFTETAGAGDTSARAPISGSGQAVYGTAYLAQFGLPSVDRSWPTSDQRVLSSISEIDMGGGTLPQQRPWSCPVTMQFKIVQPTDVFPTATGSNFVCQQQPDPNPASLSVSDQQILAAVRNVLPVGSWYLDMTNHCIIPKAQAALTSCYGNRTNSVNIDYTSGACTAFNQSTGVIGNCPHWLSICVRQ
jgi:hypothetical protein